MEYSAAKLLLEVMWTYGELDVYCDGPGCRHVFLADPDDPRMVLLVQAEEGPPSLRTYCSSCFESLYGKVSNVKDEIRKEDKPMYEIEKSVPLPKRKPTEAQNRVYPIREMEVGDSFFVPCEPLNRFKTRNKVYSSLRAYKQKGEKFSVRFAADGLRCWRVL